MMENSDKILEKSGRVQMVGPGQNFIMRQLSKNPNFTFYVGETKQELSQEDLRWLTQRGANIPDGQASGRENRPVLLKSDGAPSR